MICKSRFWADGLWFLLFAVGSSAWCLAAAYELGATFDEPIYLRAGLESWRRGSHEPLLRMGTMPLPTDLATLPLFLYESLSGSEIDLDSSDLDQFLFWARATNLLFWWHLLWFARLVGRHLAGPWGGRLAVALLACEPNFLAHASLATTDIAAAAFLLPTAYYYARGRNEPMWRRRIGWPALWFGLALFAKASALAYGPLCWLLIDLQRAVSRQPFAAGDAEPMHSPCRNRWQEFLTVMHSWWRDSWRIGALGLILVFLLCGCDWKPLPSFNRWAQGLSDGPAKEFWLGLAENLNIFSNAGQGLVYQIRHNLRGHATYLLGEPAPRSLWYYYPVLLSIKLPTPLLLLPVLIAFVRPRALGNWACIVAAGLLLYSLNCRVQIGVRLMLPWLALGVVGLAAALVNAGRHGAGGSLVLTPKRRRVTCATHPGWRRPVSATAAAVALFWLGLTAFTQWPHALCHVNELWGGPERGHELVSDSNYDWGQGLKELAAWQCRNHVDELDICYFGTDPRLGRLPMRPLAAKDMSAAELRTTVQGRYLAVGTTWLHGSYVPRGAKAADWLRTLQPAARTQTFLIYDFRSRNGCCDVD